MKRNHQKGNKLNQNVLRTWTYAQAHRAVPYVANIMRSVREHFLNLVSKQADQRRLAAKPGRPDRAAYLAQEEAAVGAERAMDALRDDLEELQAIDVYVLDPVQGEALIPFVHDEKLAWYVFSLFEEEPLKLWRFHEDPIEARRPMSELAAISVTPDVIV